MPSITTLVACAVALAYVAQTPVWVDDGAGAEAVRLFVDLVKRGLETRSVGAPPDATLTRLADVSLRCLAAVVCCRTIYLQVETKPPRRLASNLLYATLAAYLYSNPQALIRAVPEVAMEAATAAASSASTAALGLLHSLAAHHSPSAPPELQLLRHFVLERLQLLAASTYHSQSGRAVCALLVTSLLAACVIERTDRASRALRLLAAYWVLETFDARGVRDVMCDNLHAPALACDAVDAANAAYPSHASYVWLAGALLASDGVVRRVFAA